MLLSEKKIAIVGGGPGGLTLARLLQMNGVDVKVYERDSSREVRVQGATLDLHYESGLKALDKAGLMDAFKANYRPDADHTRVTDSKAHILYEDTFDHGVENEYSRPEIDRGPLRDILLDSLQPGTVVWNSHFDQLSFEGEGVRLGLKNGNTVYADLVIAADGANSKLRPYLTDIKPFYAGVTGIEGSVYNADVAVPGMSKLLNGGKIFAFGDEQSLIVSSKGDGSLVFYTGCKLEEGWAKKSGIDFNDKVQVVSWFKQKFKEWDDGWLPLFDQATTPFIVRAHYCMPFDQNWETKPNLTMLGDAAHLMPPYAGEGVNMAMLDALELSECLLNDQYPNLRSAIEAYEKQMRVRASEMAQVTMQQTEILHSPDAIPHLLALFQGH